MANYSTLHTTYAAGAKRSRTYVDDVKAVRLPGAATTVRPVHGGTDGAVKGYAVRYHNTDVVTLYSDGTVKLATGGYVSVMTGERMHAYTPAAIVVRDKDVRTSRHDADPRLIVSTRAGVELGTLRGDATLTFDAREV